MSLITFAGCSTSHYLSEEDMERTEQEGQVFFLSDEERGSIRKAFSDIEYSPEGCREYVQCIRALAYRVFPERLVAKLEGLKENDASYCVFDNVPIDTVHGSPPKGADHLGYKTGCLSENVLVAFGSLIAEPYSIHHEGARLVNDLVPHPDASCEYTGNGSEMELDFHTENACQVYDPRGDTSPAGLMLLGLRSDQNAGGPKTWVSDARAALGALTENEVELLYGRHFVIRQPYRWRTADNRASVLYPILSGPRLYPRVTAVFYPGMVTAVNDAAQAAYLKFYRAVKRVALAVDIQPGRLLYVNNRFALHAREKFTPTYDENGLAYRWVQRLFLTHDLWNFRAFEKTGARIFLPVSATVGEGMK
ncbi:TauD/TfdA family dioxygenase [Pseudomonas guariconensis]|uniref:TauD/TfdA family dioxygenase n=1 Tax=Pseudomonas TaxID=286 RepID=UPI001CE464F0|nr:MULTISPECIES: TauD/TfdA family dioxygenase [Pseudomonas]MCO7632991.1 TauD/TfdA family dioxygenase [Pseudomonas guariconensis]